MSRDTRGSGRSLEEICTGLVERLRSRCSEIEETIFAHVRDALPDQIGDEDAEYVVGLRAAVSAAVDYGLTGIEHGEGWSGPAPSAAIAQARRAARGGVGLDTVLLRYMAGYTLLEDFVMDEAERLTSIDGSAPRRRPSRSTSARPRAHHMRQNSRSRLLDRMTVGRVASTG